MARAYHVFDPPPLTVDQSLPEDPEEQMVGDADGGKPMMGWLRIIPSYRVTNIIMLHQLAKLAAAWGHAPSSILTPHCLPKYL